MELIEKIKKHGFKGSFIVCGWHCARLINKLLYYFCWIFPVDKKLILLESEGDLSDNAFALYDYMLRNGYLNKYKVVWLVENVKKAREKKYKNTDFVRKTSNAISCRRSKYLATCRYFLYDHNNVMEPLTKRRMCYVLNLRHGCGFKAAKGKIGKQKTKPDMIVTTGHLYDENFMVRFNCTRSELIDCGFSRNDYFFEDKNSRQVAFEQDYNLSEYKKVFLWMPTFRKSNTPDLNEDYFHSSTGLPIIDDLDKLRTFNSFLKTHDSLCIFKIHHLQATVNTIKESFGNILLLNDEDINRRGLQLYHIVPLTDCLITDYSSIANDYMLLNRPIVYTVDDYEEYRKSRGFVPEDPIEYFAGECVKDYNQFIEAIQRVLDGEDRYKEKRKKLMPLMHTHIDGKSSQRILKHLNIEING